MLRVKHHSLRIPGLRLRRQFRKIVGLALLFHLLDLLADLVIGLTSVGAALAIDKVHLRVGSVVSDEQGPTEKSGLASLIHLIETSRSTLRIGMSGVWPDFSPIKISCLAVHRDAERIPITHHINLWASASSAGLEEVPFRDVVAALRARFDSKHLADQRICIRGASLTIPRVTAHTLIMRRKSIGVERVGVVTNRHIEVASGVKSQRSTDMAALFPLGLDINDGCLGGKIQLIALHSKTSNPNDAHLSLRVGGGLG